MVMDNLILVYCTRIVYQNIICYLHFLIPFESSILARSSTVGQWSAGPQLHAEFTQWNYVTILIAALVHKSAIPVEQHTSYQYPDDNTDITLYYCNATELYNYSGYTYMQRIHRNSMMTSADKMIIVTVLLALFSPCCLTQQHSFGECVVYILASYA